MTTSLQEQLQRLRTPQTSLLIQSKKQPSILFDPKDAASKSRKTIYDIGYAGLKELITLSPTFRQFEQTLFDKSSIELQRAVETSEVNTLLDKNIKKFFYNLSPFLMLEPAQMCLEWLLRRFLIHEFNKNDFIALILPYHETMVFVKCVQTLYLRNPNDPWKWLQPIQKPGVPLSRNAILNRAATDNAFLQVVCKFTISAVKELGSNANHLQAQINFYCITVVGAMEHSAEINESFLTNILLSVLKGLSSECLDFAAAGLMITAQLLTKCQMSEKILSQLVNRICSVNHKSLQPSVLLLLNILYKKQGGICKEFPEQILVNFISQNWVLDTLASLVTNSIDISSICAPLVGGCLRRVQTKENGWKDCKLFLESLLNEVHFSEDEASGLIRTTLDNYHRDKPKVAELENVIEILSDEDMTVDADVQSWYTEYLQNLEKHFPGPFDSTIKEILQGQEQISERRRQTLKTVLAFRLKSSYLEKNANIYENLYHQSAYNRIEAVKFIAGNLEKLTISKESQMLLKDSLADRLNDDNPQVVGEVLQMPTDKLIQLLGINVAVDGFVEILNKSQTHPDVWKETISGTIKHITSKEVFEKADQTYIFLALLTYLLPSTDSDMSHVEQILSSDFADMSPFLKPIKLAIRDNKSRNLISQLVIKTLRTTKDLPSPAKFLDSVKNISEKFFQRAMNFSSYLLTISSCLKKTLHPSQCLTVFEFVENHRMKFTIIHAPRETDWIRLIRQNRVPLVLYCNFMEMLSISCNVEELDLFSEKLSPSTVLFLKIFDILVTSVCTSDKSEKLIYGDVLQFVLQKIFSNTQGQINLLSTFYVADRIDFEEISPELQIRTMKMFNLILIGSDQSFVIDEMIFIKVLLALTSKIATVRECALGTLRILSNCIGLDETFKALTLKILERSEETMMDEQQFPLILFNILTAGKQIGGTSQNHCLPKLIQVAASEETPEVVKAELLEVLKYINNSNLIRQVLGIGARILEDIENNSKLSENSDIILLDKVKSKILKLIVTRFDENHIKLLNEDEDVCTFIENMLKMHRVLVEGDGEVKSVSCEVMNLFTESKFDKLNSKLKSEVIKLVVEAVSFAKHISLAPAGNNLIKRINLEGKCVIPILENMKSSCIAPIHTQRGAKSVAPSASVLDAPEWKRGITVLEFLQNKKKLENCSNLIPLLFELLSKCLEFEEQSIVEYAKQLILSCLLHCCQKVNSEPKKCGREIPESLYRIDVVVECIRTTQNPQTHHHTLLLLAQLAHLTPQQVLHKITAIFTFMGSSVVRHDDSFSFQIISNIIESVIPALIKASNEAGAGKVEDLVVSVLKVFVDIALDIPEHRRLPLYIKLLRTMGAPQYLWRFICLLFSSHVAHNNKEKLSNRNKKALSNIEEVPKRVDIAFSLMKHFEPEIILQTFVDLFEYLLSLPVDKGDDADEQMDVDVSDTCLFDANAHSAKQLRHYKYIAIQFISTVSSSPEFLNAIAGFTEEQNKAVKPFYQNFIIKILTYLQVVTRAMDDNQNSAQTKFWKVLLNHCYDILNNAICLLSPDMLLSVIHGLLQHHLPTVRRKVIEILINTIQYKPDFISSCSEERLLQLLNPLNDIIDSILSKEKLMENASTNEIFCIQQIALIALKFLSKSLALNYTEEFKEVLMKLTHILKKRSVSKIILGTVVLAVTEISCNLKVHSISLLSKFMPYLIEVLKEQAKSLQEQPPEHVCIAVVAGMQKLFETLPLFLGPYIVDILASLALIWTRALSYRDQESRAVAVINRLELIWSKVATVIPVRVLIPNFNKLYVRLMEDKQYTSIRFLMKLLSESFEKSSATDIQSMEADITAFFLEALELRSKLLNYEDQAAIEVIEDYVIQAIVAHVLKLSESYFRPFYHKIYEWAIRDSDVKEKTITYFLLSSKIVQSLKSLFVLFASDFIQDAANLLDKCNAVKSNPLYFSESKEKNAVLIKHILHTLYNVFLYDSKGFINPHRFDILMQPIVDQLENPIVVENDQLRDLVVSCISQLAVTVSNDSSWKELNYQVLLKTRNNNPENRILSFNCCVEVTRKLGESFSPLLPETIPFIAELFEDENEMVERNCRKGVQEMEKILGESLQSYF